MQQNRSPGPVYDASRGYNYLEQVPACMQIKCNHHISGGYALLTMAASKHTTYFQIFALSCAQLRWVCPSMSNWADCSSTYRVSKSA